MNISPTQAVCLVTGGAQGVGWALVQTLADSGAEVFACDLSTENLAQATAALTLLPWADRIHLTQCDVTNRSAVEAWINGVYQQTGRIDLLINNAAYTKWVDAVDMTVEEAEQTMRVGFYGMLYTIKAALPFMCAARRGHIVNIGSAAGKVFIGGASAAYAATKAAVDGYSQTLALELEQNGIHVMLVRPATIAGTDFFRKHVPSSRLPRLGDFVAYMTPPQVAAAIVQGIERRRRVLNIPGNLILLYFFFEFFPSLLRWLTSVGGKGKREYGHVAWRYVPRTMVKG